jgi:hypothetical protein
MEAGDAAPANAVRRRRPRHTARGGRLDCSVRRLHAHLNDDLEGTARLEHGRASLAGSLEKQDVERRPPRLESPARPRRGPYCMARSDAGRVLRPSAPPVAGMPLRGRHPRRRGYPAAARPRDVASRRVGRADTRRPRIWPLVGHVRHTRWLLQLRPAHHPRSRRRR